MAVIGQVARILEVYDRLYMKPPTVLNGDPWVNGQAASFVKRRIEPVRQGNGQIALPLAK